MSTIFLFVALALPGEKPVLFEIPMASAIECLGEVNFMIMRAAELHRPGKIQFSCVVVTDDKQVSH